MNEAEMLLRAATAARNGDFDMAVIAAEKALSIMRPLAERQRAERGKTLADLGWKPKPEAGGKERT